MRTIIEPFKIKSVEPINFTTDEERAVLLKEAHYNPFLLKSKDVIIDLLTDSGTGAMSSEQWAGVMRGDESYAGSDSFFRFEAAVRDLTSMPFIIPVHQGRAAEKILFTIKGGEGKYVVSNTLFDTTRANIEFSGAIGVDLLTKASQDPAVPAPFKGNMDTKRLREFIRDKGAGNISLVIMTVTNNSGGGQPVSMGNIREVKAICSEYKIPFFIDACRFAENCYFIKLREPGFENMTIKAIAQELFSYADGCTMSAKKDAFANIGGFLAVYDEQLAEECRNLLIITEGFPTYGGLSGRDLDAIAIGLKEIVEEDYLKYRIRSIEYIGEKLDEYQVPYLKPTGGHALYLDAKSFLPHVPVYEFPGQALCAALYLEGGIRAVEIGSVMFGEHAQQELVRLAIPRRTYTQSHMDYLTEVIISVFNKRSDVRGMKMVYETRFLRHFTAKFELISV